MATCKTKMELGERESAGNSNAAPHLRADILEQDLQREDHARENTLGAPDVANPLQRTTGRSLRTLSHSPLNGSIVSRRS
jgi:hypothetical protein